VRKNLFVSKIYIILLVAVISTFFYLTGTFDNIENITLDQLFKYRKNLLIHPKITGETESVLFEIYPINGIKSSASPINSSNTVLHKNISAR